MLTAINQYCLFYEGGQLMDSIRQYFLTVITAAAICGCLNALFHGKGTFGTIIKLLTGIFLAVTIISPVTKLDLRNYTSFFDEISAEAKLNTDFGAGMAQDATRSIIKSQTEAYILDKAASLKLEVTVDVEVDSTGSWVPCGVTITGPALPYAKRRLQQYIVQDLGIPEEKQKWM